VQKNSIRSSLWTVLFQNRVKKDRVKKELGVYICVCVRAHAYIYICVYACIYKCVYACIYKCVYACIYVCVFVFVFMCVYIYKCIITQPSKRNRVLIMLIRTNIKEPFCGWASSDKWWWWCQFNLMTSFKLAVLLLTISMTLPWHRAQQKYMSATVLYCAFFWQHSSLLHALNIKS
jgi:hypothetical protein